MRARYVVLSLGLVMALGSAGISGAGNGDIEEWFNFPVEGPSPNTEHLVGSTEGGECGVDDPGPLSVESSGSAVLAGPPSFLPGEVSVALWSQDGEDLIAGKGYFTDEQGHWGGDFPIPPGLDPGLYPLTAACFFDPEPQGLLGQGLVTLGGEEEPLFFYEDRFYIVIAERKPAKAVEAEVKLTG